MWDDIENKTSNCNNPDFLLGGLGRSIVMTALTKPVRRRDKKVLPVRDRMCATCPFHEAGWTHVRDFLKARALSEASPICHSTGKSLVKCEGKAQVCRGARNYQIEYFYHIGFLSAPTDAAWAAKLAEIEGCKK